MNVLEMFALLAELNVAIAGFAGIVSAFRFRDESNVKRGPVAALTVIVQLSLVVALFSGLPLLLSAFGLSGNSLWLTCSIVAVPVGSGLIYTNRRNFRRSLQDRKARLIHIFVQSISFIAVLANVLNTLNIFFHYEPGPYLLAGIVMSGIAGWMFIRLLLNPLWKLVRENEARE